MSTVIQFKSYDLECEFDLFIPDGLRDEKALKDYINQVKHSFVQEDEKGNVTEVAKKMSRRDRRAAFKQAKKHYKAYNKEWWETNDE